MKDMKKTGKKNRAAGARFELKVRKDLEFKGWIVSKWMNNVELAEDTLNKFQKRFDKEKVGTISVTKGQPIVWDRIEIKTKLIPAKHKFRGPGIPMAIGTGFPDFIAFKTEKTNVYGDPTPRLLSRIVGVESKMNGYLDKKEK